MDDPTATKLKKTTLYYFLKFKSTLITELLLLTLIVCALINLIQFHWKRRRMYMLAAKISGPCSLPLIGSAHLFAGSKLSKKQSYFLYQKKSTPILN